MKYWRMPDEVGLSVSGSYNKNLNNRERWPWLHMCKKIPARILISNCRPVALLVYRKENLMRCGFTAFTEKEKILIC